jgi:FkbM family methyltransferase
MEVLIRASRGLRRRIYELFGNPKYSKPSLNDLDNKLVKYLNFRGGFFIEVGANDGYSQSNTYYLEKILGWQGVLIEAIPELYKMCRRQRRKAHVYDCALVAKDYGEPTIQIHFANLMSVIEGSQKNSVAQAKHIADGLRVQNLAESYNVRVPARTLESILDELPQPLKIDFFSLDVEGYELSVLKGINLEKYGPKYILVEATFFDEVNSFLADRYELLEKMSDHDYLYRLKENT